MASRHRTTLNIRVIDTRSQGRRHEKYKNVEANTSRLKYDDLGKLGRINYVCTGARSLTRLVEEGVLDITPASPHRFRNPLKPDVVASAASRFQPAAEIAEKEIV